MGPLLATFPEDPLVSTSGGETSPLGDVTSASLEGTMTLAAAPSSLGEDALLHMHRHVLRN